MHNVTIATPTLSKPFPGYLESLEASVPHLNKLDIHHSTVFEIGCPYISHARARMLRKALDGGADTIIFIDHDIEWQPSALIDLINDEHDVVAGTYRFKTDQESYMATLYSDDLGKPKTKGNYILAEYVPAGFLKVTRKAVAAFMRSYPELLFGDFLNPSIDLFNHGAIDGVWHGEDYAFSKRWREMGNDLLLLPDLNLTHHSADKAYPGNFHEYLLRQPGGKKREK